MDDQVVQQKQTDLTVCQVGIIEGLRTWLKYINANLMFCDDREMIHMHAAQLSCIAKELHGIANIDSPV